MAKKQALIYSQLPYQQLINTEDSNKAISGGIQTAGPLNGKWQNSTDDYYRSIVFTSDGYILTHGQAFKVLNTLNETLSLSNTDGKLSVSFGGLTSGKVDILIGAENGNHTTATVTKGKVKFNHNTPGTGTSSLGAYFGNGDNKYQITTKTATYDSYGHINGTILGTATHIDYITDEVANNSTNYYLLGATSSSKATDYYAPKKHSGLYASVDNNGKVTLHADNIAASVSSLTGTLGVCHGGTGTTLFTKGEVLIGNGTNAIQTKSIDTTVTNSSSNLITSGAVYTAIANSFAANDAMVFKGITGAPTSTGKAIVTPTTDNAGYTWKVGTAGYFNPTDGKIYSTSGTGRQKVEIGDLIICITDAKTENGTTTNATYGIIQTNIENPISGFIGGTSSSLKRAVLQNIQANDGYLYIEQLMRPIKVGGQNKIASNADTALDFKAGTGLEVTYDSGVKYSLSSISGLTAGSSGIYKIAYNAQGQITSASSWDPNTLTIKSSGNAITNALAYDPDSTVAQTINFTNGLQATWANNIYTVGHVQRFGTGGTTSGTASIYKIAYDNYGHITNTSSWNPSTITFSNVYTARNNTTASNSYGSYDPDGTAITIQAKDGLALYSADSKLTIGHSTSGASSMTTGGRTYINSITIDSYGHVTSLSTGKETVVNTWRPVQLYKINTANGKPQNRNSSNAWEDLSWDSSTRQWLGEKVDEWKSNSTSTQALVFSSSFTLNSAEELDIAWAEIDSNGNITYAV